MSRTYPRGCLTSPQRPPPAAAHRQCRAALGGGGAEDWVGGRCRHRSTAGGGAYARRMAGGGSRARVARLAVVRWSWTRRGGTATGSTCTFSREVQRARIPRCGAASRRSLGLCSLLLQRHRSCAVLLAAARVPGRTAAFSSPLRVLSSRHPPCLRLDHVHALVRLYRSTRSRSSTRLGCTGRPAHFKPRARPFAPSSSNT